MSLFQVIANANVDQMGCFGKKNAEGRYTMFTCVFANVNQLEKKPIYETGYPCQKCPKETKCQQKTGLCSK